MFHLGKTKAFFAIILMLCLLPAAGCGKDKEKAPTPPESYALGEDSAPPLDKQLTEEDGKLTAVEEKAPEPAADGEKADPKADEKDGEAKATAPEKTNDKKDEKTDGKKDAEKDKAEKAEPVSITYTYGDLKTAGTTVESYVKLLTEPEAGFALQEETPPDYTGAEGSLTLAKASTQEGCIFQIFIEWKESGCTVTVSRPEGSTKGDEPENLTWSEAIDFLQKTDPAKLGLTGSMADYSIIPYQGLVEVDGMPAVKLTVYGRTSYNTNIIAGTYLITQGGQSIYKISQEGDAQLVVNS